MPDASVPDITSPLNCLRKGRCKITKNPVSGLPPTLNVGRSPPTPAARNSRFMQTFHSTRRPLSVVAEMIALGAPTSMNIWNASVAHWNVQATVPAASVVGPGDHSYSR